MLDKETTSLREMLEQLPTEQLDDMLNQELEKAHPDAAAVRTIMDVLWDREKDDPIEITPKIRDAWKKYRRNIAQLEKRERRFGLFQSGLFRAVVAAMMLCVLIVAMPRRAEADSLFDKLANLTDTIVEFFSPETRNDNPTQYRFQTDNPGLQQVYEAVTELGVTVPVVPMRLPEGYALVECEKVDTSNKTGIAATFQSEESDFYYKLDMFTVDVSHKYHRDETPFGTYEICDVTHTIFRNNDKWVVIWFQDKIECSLTLDCQEDTLHEILASIYVTEDIE